MNRVGLLKRERTGLFSSAFEEKGFKLMFFMNSYPRYLWLADKRVTKLSDIKGLKIRGTAAVHVQVAKALGATAVGISPAGPIYGPGPRND